MSRRAGGRTTGRLVAARTPACDFGAGGAGAETERGGATVLVLAVGLVFVLFGIFGAAVTAAQLARQRAAVAADFGALAGAGRAIEGEPIACARAADLVAGNGGRLVTCRLDGLDALVTVEVTIAPLPGLVRVATVSARAGPVTG
ncbi:Rv3654c family TadE-like protein [Micromonospora sp. NPDC049366]|uniref:Rv3654c family TadE-like protein n=1 Tax=Micromonospora sp. NPDC049366 TaxID=3364271 RepID=UPI0037B2E61C